VGAGAAAAALTLVGGGCEGTYSDYQDNCGYCNGAGRNYYHCDGNYCNYINYADG